jgi:hypothetical protein
LPTTRIALPSANGQATSGQAKEEEQPRNNATRILKQSPPGVNGSSTKVLLSPPDRQSSKRSSDATNKPSDPDQIAAITAFSQHTQDMRRLLAQATNVDECRLIVDMFLAKSGVQLEHVDQSKPSTQAIPSQPLPSGVDARLEHSLIELFLGGAGEEGGGDGDEQPSSPATGAINKDGSVALPMSPPDTPHSVTVPKSVAPVVVEHAQVATATP